MNVHILHTPMTTTSRTPEGDTPRWCFRCRTRRQFVRVVSMPVIDPDAPMFDEDGTFSPPTGAYYGPSVAIRCGTCNTIDGDMFPGTWREWED